MYAPPVFVKTCMYVEVVDWKEGREWPSWRRSVRKGRGSSVLDHLRHKSTVYDNTLPCLVVSGTGYTRDLRDNKQPSNCLQEEKKRQGQGVYIRLSYEKRSKLRITHPCLSMYLCSCQHRKKSNPTGHFFFHAVIVTKYRIICADTYFFKLPFVSLAAPSPGGPRRFYYFSVFFFLGWGGLGMEGGR